MKKIILSLTLAVLCGSYAYAVMNTPSAPTYTTPETKINTNSSNAKYKKTNVKLNTPSAPTYSKSTTTSSASSSSGNSPLNSLAMSVLKAAENRNNAEMNSYLQKMAQKGVTEVTVPQVVQKKTPQCPPIQMELNGRTISGSLCTRFSYTYKGKEYWVGYCK